MKVIAISRLVEGTNPDEIEAQQIPETLKAWEYYRDGIFREMYWRADGKPGVIIVLETQNVEHANKILESLPMVQIGALGFDVIPVGAYDHYDRLFREDYLAKLGKL